MTEVLKKLAEKYLACQSNLVTEKEKLTCHPAYLVVYLVHILACLEDFPPDDSLDEGAYAELSRCIFYVTHCDLVNLVQFEAHVVQVSF
jgi:hypothetical protein